MRSRYQATLAGFCCSAAGNFLLMMLGDAM